MDRLALNRERLQKAGVKNADEVLSVTGFEKDAITAAKMGVPLEHIPTVSKMLEDHASPESITLALKLGAPYHTLPGVQKVMDKHGWGAFAELQKEGTHLSRKQRKELVLNKGMEGVLATLNKARALGLRGKDRFEAIDYLDVFSDHEKNIDEAIAAGIPATHLQKGMRMLWTKGDAAKKVLSAAAKKGATSEEMGELIETIDQLGVKPVSEAQELHTPPKYLADVAMALESYGIEPVKKALSMGTPYPAVKYPAGIIKHHGKDGERMLEQIRKLGIPPQYIYQAESLFRNKQEGFVERAKRMGVRSHSIVPVATGIMHYQDNIRRAIEKNMPQEKLYDTAYKLNYNNVNFTEDDFAGATLDFVHFADPQKDSRIVAKALEGAGKYLEGTGKESIGRKKLLALARTHGASYSAFKAFGNKNQYTRQDLAEIRNTSDASVAASQISRNEGVSLFPCGVAIYPQSHFDDEGDSRTLVVYPPAEEGERLARNGHALISGFEQDAIASVRFQKRDDTLYVTNLQSGFGPNTPKEIVTKYSGWKEATMYLLKEMYANPNGIREICITPTKHQVEKSDVDIHPSTAVEVYTKFPSRQGYRLVQKQDLQLEYHDAPLIWSKKTTGPSAAFNRLLAASKAQPSKIKFVE